MPKLIYLRLANKWLDGFDGLLYRFEWPTGWQEVAFSNADAASKWFESVKSSYIHNA